MGRGDQKSRRGKIRRGTYGKKRPHKPKRAKKAKPANEGSIDERLN
jgi:30S ribosomal protein S31